MSYTFLVVDDEKLNRNYLKDLILELDRDAVIHEANSVATAVDFLKKQEPDFLFLDIKMPGEEGFSVLNKITSRNFVLVVVTAYSNYAIQALKEGASDYLLKPIKKSDFAQTFSKILSIKEREDGIKNILQKEATDIELSRKLIIRHQAGVKILPVRDIVCLEADNTYTTIHLHNNEKVLTSKPISHFEKTLNSRLFFRIHKTFIINLHHFKEYSSLNDFVAIMDNGMRLKISRYRLADFLQKIGGKNVS